MVSLLHRATINKVVNQRSVFDVQWTTLNDSYPQFNVNWFKSHRKVGVRDVHGAGQPKVLQLLAHLWGWIRPLTVRVAFGYEKLTHVHSLDRGVRMMLMLTIEAVSSISD